MTYNVDEHQSDNHYNCPLVAYYPEVIAANTDFGDTKFVYPYLSFEDEKSFNKAMRLHFSKVGIDFSLKALHKAFIAGNQAYEKMMNKLHQQHEVAMSYAEINDCDIVLLCGRPYHLDPLINHQIDQLLNQLGFVVLSEESVPHLDRQKVNVLNQWTYHARLYQAAKYCSQYPNMELVQLVSFGCGIDSITSDEVRDILASNNKFYTQIKIDEIDNLGAARIRLRSLKEASKEKRDELR